MRQKTLVFSLVFLAPAAAQYPEFTSPSVLSRSGSIVPTRNPRLVTLRPFLQLTGTYDTGLVLPSVTRTGEVLSAASYGVAGSAGLAGYHTWRHSVLGMDYSGNYRHYARATYLDGVDQILSLRFAHELSRRMSFTVGGHAGTYSRGYGVMGVWNYAGMDFGDAGAGVDPNRAYVPQNDLFDSRTYYGSAGGDFVFQKNARLSFSAGGTAFLVRRRSKALTGVDGSTSRGDVVYRLSRRHSLGFAYGFTHFHFDRTFGTSDMHSGALNYAALLSRYWRFSAAAGTYRVESLRLIQVPLDPMVAAILGESVGIEAAHRVNYTPLVTASLTRVFKKASLSFLYSRVINPGNGIFLTSSVDRASATYNFTGSRRWSFAASVNYDKFRDVTQNLGLYEGYYSGASTSYRLTRYAHLRLDFFGRHQTLSRSDYVRTSYSATVGITLSPRDVPLSLW